MSISKPAKSPSEKQTEQQSALSIEEKIRETLSAIQEIIQTQHAKGFASGLIHAQINSLIHEGFELPLISQSMVIAKVSLKTLLRENRSLTTAEIKLIMSTCKDLTESSGSGTSSQKMTSEERPEPPQELPPSRLPLKKRPLKQVEKIGAPVITTGEPSVKKKRSEEALSSSLQFLLKTIRDNKNTKAPYPVYCPEASRELVVTHQCTICSLTKNIINQGNHHLIFQLEQLVGEVCVEDLTKATMDLIHEGKVKNLQKGLALSNLEAGYLAIKCKLENKLGLEEKKVSLELLNVYQIAKDVASMGIEAPLTKFIMQLWGSQTKLKTPDIILAADSNGNPSVLSVPLFLPTFSSLNQRKLFSGGTLSLRPFSIHFSIFLAKTTMTTLHAIINSPQNESYVVETPFKKKAILWRAVNHTLGLILASASDWFPEVPCCRLSIGASEDLRFRKEDLEIASQKQKMFVETNRILLPQIAQPIPFVGGLPKESCLLNSSLTQRQVPVTHTPSESSSESPQTASISTSLKHRKKTHHTEPSTETKQAPCKELSSASFRQKSSHLQTLLFLLEMVLINKQRASPKIHCPRSTSENSLHHICSLCFLAKILFHRKRLLIVAQLEVLLAHTTKNDLANAILKLPFNRTIYTLFEQEVLSPLDLSYIIFICKIGEAMQLPGKSNPAIMTGLYYSIEKIVLEGFENPMTVLINNLWKHTIPEPSKFVREKGKLTVLTLKSNSLKLLSKSEIMNCFSTLELQTFQKCEGKVVRRYRKSMDKAHINFFGSLVLFTLQDLLSFNEARPYLTNSPAGLAIPWELVQHVCSLILAINPAQKVSITGCKASLGKLQELGFPREQGGSLFQNLQLYANRNSISVLAFR
ncbi:hypothetical protein [Chlamydiifrater volucris]|uniref:hypothetical protein n=1 Tax=Chlamydiifrater volucris TaxID=2681470 RepID=UPI0032B22507